MTEPAQPRSSHRSSHRRRRSSSSLTSGRSSHENGAEPELGGASRPFDAAAEAVVYGLLAFAPLAFGTTQAWSREVFLLLVAAAACCVAAKHVALAWAGERSGYRWSWVYVLVAAFLVLCGLQATSWPAGWVNAVSPGTIRARSELLSDLPDAATLLRRASVSFYPWATRQQMVMVAAVGVLFAVVVDVFRDRARIRRLLSVIAGVGLAVAGLAAYQNLTHATTVYGLVPAGQRNSGPFMAYSHFSQFMNLSIGAGLALLLDRLVELSDFYRSPAEWWHALRQPRNAVVWLWATLCVLGPTTVLLSMSRMGMISLFVAAVVSGGMLFWRGRSAIGTGGSSRAWPLVGLGLLVFTVLLYVGFDAVYTRLASVRDLKTTGRRQEMLRDMVPIFRQFPLVGTGLGTHEFVFGRYDRRGLPQRATHAENEYAQLMEETGVAGVLLAAGFVAALAANYWRATRRPVGSFDFVPFGLGFGLVAILAHSNTDFGQHLPPNAALTATFAALLVTLARRRPEPAPLPSRRWGPVVGHAAVLAGAIAAAVAVGLWSDRARAAEATWQTAVTRGNALAAVGWQGSPADFVDVLAPATAAIDLEPGDVGYRYWTDVYRWHAITQQTAGQTQLPTAALPFAEQVVDDLRAARLLCPTYGPPLCLAGQIDLFALNRPDEGRWEVRLGAELAPFDPTVCLIAGWQALQAHDWDAASADFARHVELGGSARDFTDMCLQASQPIIPYRLARGDRGTLLYMASRMPANDPGWQPWIARLRSDATALLVADAARPDAAPDVLAELAAADRDQGRLPEAIDLYRRALADQYGNTGWRMDLARCLAAAGRPADAAKELRVCLQLRPELPGARALLDECDARVRSGATTAP